ncbi:MAG: adenine deaminase [Ignavibacteria bacterium]|jgi:adenine deaminase|nr:adenine deaminase [Ignavibacteria bacterium]
MPKDFEISGNLVDIINRKIEPSLIKIKDGKIHSIQKSQDEQKQFIMPGFVDSHIHIESSMLTPSEFARLAVIHGTVATCSDPHEIANVLGIKGIEFMLRNANKVPFKFYFGAPSCVPATDFESAGARISPDDIRFLFKEKKLKYLSEMMNFPGVIYESPDPIEKLNIAKEYKKPIDGHAPGLRGDDLKKYIAAGISTDHECFRLEEALEKIGLGMKILIREGSAAKNFEVLSPLLESHHEMCMFSSDDKHPQDLMEGHINLIVKRAVSQGYELFSVLRAAILNPIEHYNLDIGMLKIGDDADFIIVDNLKDFTVQATYIKGNLVAERGKSLIEPVQIDLVNNFNIKEKKISDFEIKAEKERIRVIEVIDGQLFTNELIEEAKIEAGKIVSDPEKDILKLALVNRYKESPPALAFVQNFGLKKGSIATSIAHDSHNIIALGCDDESLCKAINEVIKNKGGLALAHKGELISLPMPIAGIMSDEDAQTVAKKYILLDNAAKKLGSTLSEPFMTLSFLALLVIPKLKLSDKGLFDGDAFQFVDLQL